MNNNNWTELAVLNPSIKLCGASKAKVWQTHHNWEHLKTFRSFLYESSGKALRDWTLPTEQKWPLPFSDPPNRESPASSSAAEEQVLLLLMNQTARQNLHEVSTVFQTDKSKRKQPDCPNPKSSPALPPFYVSINTNWLNSLPSPRRCPVIHGNVWDLRSRCAFRLRLKPRAAAL